MQVFFNSFDKCYIFREYVFMVQLIKEELSHEKN